VLMVAATVLSVTFATRGAMATNKTVIEVLHFVGAKNGFIASNFQRHFLLLGLQGGAVGGGAAILLFGLASLISRWFAGSAGADQTSALFGSFSIGLVGYLAVLVQIVFIAAVTAFTSRQTVNRTLETID
jgi:cell division transport system permease protein